MKKNNGKNRRNNNCQKCSPRPLPVPRVIEAHFIAEDVIQVPRMEYNRLVGTDYAMDILRNVLETQKYPPTETLRAIAGVVLLEDKHE